MADFARARRAMVDGQLRTSGITDMRILDMMNRVPREEFVPAARRQLAYIDEEVELAGGRMLLAPAEFARLLQLAEVGSDDVVLDVACGSGYSSAVIAGLASAVVGLEEHEDLVTQANETLAALDIGNAAIVTGALEQGVKREAPFDAIIIEGAVDEVPEILLSQLKGGGRLAAVVGRGNAAVATLYVKSGKDVFPRRTFNASLPLLQPFAKDEDFAF